MLTQSDIKHWQPHPALRASIADRIADGARVLEVGPGPVPFWRATHFVDWRASRNVVACDLSRERLPFADKEFDFVYCRHVLEDLYNPFLACEEMSRVAKAGYAETPSPLAEVCRGIDGGSPQWRGYHHHRYLVWVADDVLHFAAKYPAIEYLDFGDETAISDRLRGNPFLWNTVYFWQDEMKWKLLQHGIEYLIGGNYRDVIVDAIEAGVRNSTETAPKS